MTTAGTDRSFHIDFESLGVYLEGHSSEAERRDVEAHLASCQECYELFVGSARALNVERSPVEPAPERTTAAAQPIRPAEHADSRSYRWLSAAAVLVAGVGLALAFALWPRTGARSSPEYQDLVASLSNVRMVSGRLAGGVPYAPPPAVVRGAASEAASPRTQSAAARVQAALSTDNTAEARAIVGVSYLVTGAVVEAVESLERAVAADPINAAAQNDLAVALLERQSDRPDEADSLRALTAATRAVQLKPRMPEARFNQALALERLGRRDEALAAWRAFLELDGTSGWSDEARSRIASLER